MKLLVYDYGKELTRVFYDVQHTSDPNVIRLGSSIAIHLYSQKGFAVLVEDIYDENNLHGYRSIYP